MKVIKIIFAFIIFYFMITMFSGMVSLAKAISGGSQIIEIGFYVLIGVLVLIYLVRPILKYFSYPSSKLILKMHEGDVGATKRLYKHYRRVHNIEKVTGNDTEQMKTGIKKHIHSQVDGFNGEIQKTALKLTTSVIISPNSFIDGLIIILGNSQLIYKLSKKLGIRYSFKELVNMYFKVFSVASVSGIIQEFDEEIEDFIMELVETISKDAGKSIPFLKVAVNAFSPIVQASLNYAFIVYNGMKFKHSMLKLVDNNSDTEKEISQKARKEARKARRSYFKDMVSKVKSKKSSSSDSLEAVLE